MKLVSLAHFVWMLLVLSFVEIANGTKDPKVLSQETRQSLLNLIKCNNRMQQQGHRHRGRYRSLDYFAKADHGSVGCRSSVTFTTHADYTFLDNVIPLVANWNGPVSVAVFAPGSDFQVAVNSIRYLRDCTNTPQVKQFVSFHIYFPTDHTPEKIPKSSEIFKKPYNCKLPAPYYSGQTTYRKKNNLMYPINVGRNIAIETAPTYYILPADIELYPSHNIGPQFLQMIARNKPPLDSLARRVFPVNIFEITKDAKWPANKNELLKLYKSKKASPFQDDLCRTCHLTPMRDEWLSTGEAPTMEVHAIAKRVGKFDNWEPTFICTKDDPRFEERHSWEGMQDKMSLAYRMCLQDFDFMVLNNAFLYHKPSTKSVSPNKERLKHIRETNNMIKNELFPEYKRLHGERDGCKMTFPFA